MDSCLSLVPRKDNEMNGKRDALLFGAVMTLLASVAKSPAEEETTPDDILLGTNGFGVEFFNRV